MRMMFLLVMLGVAFVARAGDVELKGHHGVVVLKDSECHNKDTLRLAPDMKLAVLKRTSDGEIFFGCWLTNTRGNPIVAWTGLGVEEIGPGGIGFLTWAQWERMKTTGFPTPGKPPAPASPPAKPAPLRPAAPGTAWVNEVSCSDLGEIAYWASTSHLSKQDKKILGERIKDAQKANNSRPAIPQIYIDGAASEGRLSHGVTGRGPGWSSMLAAREDAILAALYINSACLRGESPPRP